VQAFVKRLESSGLAPGSVHVIFHVLGQVFAAAVDDRLISTTPCRRIALPKRHDDEVVPPTVEQVAAAAAAIGPQWRALVVTLAGSGLRIGELLGLEVADVDFLRRTIRVERQRHQTGTIGPVKSRTSRRVVPVGRVVIEELAAHLSAFPSEGGLFLDELGAPLRYRRWKTLWAAAARSAGLDFTAHSLRHFYASALIAGGASVKQVQERLGHSSPMITLKTYAHLWPGDDDRTRDVIDAALGPLADSLRTGVASDG
jgi:integrase